MYVREISSRYYNLTEPVWQPDNYVGEANFLALISKHPNIKLVLSEKVTGVEMGVTKVGQEPAITG